MASSEHSNILFEALHLDFVELEKAEGIKETQAFLPAMDQCTRIVVTWAVHMNSKRVTALPGRGTHAPTKAIIDKNGLAFIQKCFETGWQQRRTCIKLTASSHIAANGLDEHVIRDVKQSIHLHPDFPCGWCLCFEAATHHHTQTDNTAQFTVHYMGNHPSWVLTQNLG